MKIDLHTHILPPEWPDLKEKFGYGGFVSLEHHAPCRAKMLVDGKFFREIEDNCWDPARRVAECDVFGVNVQVLSTVPVMFSYWTKPRDGLFICQMLNDHIASAVAEQPDRFIGLGAIPMQDPQLACRELDRCVIELGMAGVQIGSNVNGTNLDDPALFPVFERAAQLNASVFVHPWEVLGKDRLGKYWLAWLVGMPAETAAAICSLLLGGVLERLPTLRICFAHGGGAFAGTFGRINRGFHARPDLCAIHTDKTPTEYLGRFFVDSLVHDAMMLDKLIDMLGSNRVALGSDYPFPLGEERPGSLIESMTHLSAETKDWLLWRTAIEFLGPPAARFGPQD